MVNDYKIVDFNQYCQKCEYLDLAEHEDPCHECLNNPGMINSHKPLNFKEQTNKKKRKKEGKKNGKSQNNTAVLAFQNQHHLEYWFRKLYLYFTKNDTYLSSKQYKSITIKNTKNSFTFIFCINGYKELAEYHNFPIFYNVEYRLGNNMIDTLNDIFGGKSNGIN